MLKQHSLKNKKKQELQHKQFLNFILDVHSKTFSRTLIIFDSYYKI